VQYLICVGLASEKETRISGSEEHWTESGTDIERRVFFSDAVFAIAITLLVLDLRVPLISESTAASELPDALLELWPNAFSFLVSFCETHFSGSPLPTGKDAVREFL